MEREQGKLAQGLLWETGTALLAGNGCGGRLPTALHSTPCLPLAAMPGGSASLHGQHCRGRRSLFCSSLPLVISLLPLALHHRGGWTEGYLGLPPHPLLPRRA